MRPNGTLLLLALIGATIATAGFYTGYANAQPLPADDASAPKPSEVKVPPTLLVLLASQGDLKLSQGQKTKLKDIRDRFIPRYLEGKKQYWEKQPGLCKQEEDGNLLHWNLGITLNTSGFSQRDFRVDRIRDEADAAVEAILPRSQYMILVYRRQSLDAEIAASSLALLLAPETEQKLHLSRRQHNQFSLLKAVFAQYANKKLPPELISPSTMAPIDDEANLNRLLKADVDSKRLWLSGVIDFLSPMQQLNFQAMVEDRFYVRG